MKLYYLFLCFTLAFGLNSYPNEKDNDVKEVLSNKVMRVFDAEKTNHIEQKNLVALLIDLSSFNKRKMKEYNRLCSGSVISERWIVTSAHCFHVDNKDEYIIDLKVEISRRRSNKWVLLGKAPKGNIIIHPMYEHDPKLLKIENDIAVVETINPMKLDKNLVPIKLHHQPIDQSTIAIIAGYGQSEFDELDPREGLVTVTPCSITYASKLLCSYNLARAGSGDSGGPLISKMGTLLGVTSASCEEVHLRQVCRTLYVDVHYYLDWIKTVTGVE